MKKFLSIVIFLWPQIVQAQIAPECAGIEKPTDYDEENQRSFMQNYSISMFMPLPIIDSHPSDQARGAIGIDTTFVPKLTCRERLALNATKTEETDKIPLLPRPRLSIPIFQNSRFALVGAVSFLPPLIPKLLLWHVSTEGSFLYELINGIVIGARAFMGVSYLRAEIAAPFEKSAQTKEDWLSSAMIGGDFSVSFGVPIMENQKLYPFLSFGLIKGASIFIVADDGVSVPNKYPLFTLTNFVGLSYHLFDRLKVAFVVGGTISTLMTGHLRLAYLF